jgi:probable HAF family extracellular repeat protein
VAIVVLLLAAAQARPGTAAEYAVTDLAFVNRLGAEGIEGALSKPWVSINNDGQVAISGQPTGIGIGLWHGLFYSGGQSTILPNGFKAFGVDPAGNVLGAAAWDGYGIYTDVAVWYPDGTTTVLGQPDNIPWPHDIHSSAAYAANDQGKIVGGSDPFGHEFGSITGGVSTRAFERPSHAFLYDQGVFHDLGTLGGTYSVAYGINNNGRIVGMSTTAEPAPGVPAVFHAAYSDGGAFQDLNSLIGPSDWTLASATDINDAGQVTGWGTVNGQTQAYLYDAGGVQGLGILPGYDFSVGRGVNAAGDIVGFSATGEIADTYTAADEAFYWALTSTGQDRAFLFRNGTMHDLNSLIDPASGWTILGATDINDSGQIVGWGTLAGEEPVRVHALLLTPVPEPSTLLLAGVAMFALVGWRATQRRGGR